jgi:hypothetical protein
MVFSATFNNISAIPGRSVLLLGETRVPGVNDKLLSHIIVSSTLGHERESNSQLLWW